MGRFLMRRLGEAALALMGIMVLIFGLLHLYHGSPAAAMLGKQVSPKRIAELNAQMGLNLPVPVQFFLWMKAALWNGGIGAVLVKSLPPTLLLLGLGVLVAALLSVLVATLQVRHSRSLVDRALGIILNTLSAIPGFWLGSLLVFVFGVTYPILPASGVGVIHHGIVSLIRHEIMPVLTLALTVVGPWSRHLRASLEDAATSDYVRTARAKGVAESQMIRRHTFKNSLLPLITLIGMSLPTLLNTVIAIEIIFAMPGLGGDLIGSLNGLFFAMATTVSLVLALVTVAGNVVADTLYGLIDPRIQYR